MHPSLRILTIAALALGAAACSDVTQANPTYPHATLSLYGMSASGSALSAIMLDSDSGPPHPGRIDPANVDSIIVNITGVALHPRLHLNDSLFPEPGDSLHLPLPPGGEEGPFGPGNPPPGRHGDGHGGMGMGDGDGPDSLHADDDSLPRWILLNVVSGGHVDLMHLPTDSGSGIVVAAGDVPAGDYNGVRLEISDGAIYLKTDIVTPMGDTLLAGTAIPVRFLHAGIMIRAQVTVPEGGGDFPIVFDAATTIGNAIVTPQGEVIITPVMRHGHRGPGGHMEPDADD